MSALLFDRLHSGLQDVISLRKQQHALSSSNIANVDTPGFQARAIDFSDILSQAVHLGDEGPVAAGQETELSPELVEYEPLPYALDDTSVFLERENARLTENGLALNAVTDGISRRLAMLRFAANDGKR